MALSFTRIAAASLADTGGGTSYATPLWTPTDGRLYYVAVHNIAASPGTATLAGNSQTWVEVGTFSAGSARTTVFRCVAASATSGALTATLSSNTTACSIEVVEVTGFDDSSGSNGSGATVQSAGNGAGSGTSASVTLAAFADATNNAAVIAKVHRVNEGATPEAGYTELWDVQNGGGGDAATAAAAWKAGQDTSPSYSWSTSANWTAVGWEVRASASGTPVAWTATPGDLTVDGPDATVAAGTSVSWTASPGDLAADGPAPTVVAGTAVSWTATPADLTVDGPAATVSTSSSVSWTAGPGDLAADGPATVVSAGSSVSWIAIPGDMADDGPAAVVSAGTTVTWTATPGDLLADGPRATYAVSADVRVAAASESTVAAAAGSTGTVSQL